MAALVVHAAKEDERLHFLVRLLEQIHSGVKFVDTFDAAARTLSTHAGAQSIVVIPDLSGDLSRVEEAVRFAEHVKQQAFVVYIGDSMSADAYKALVRTGSGEWIKWQTLAAELMEVSRRRATGAVNEQHAAAVISIVPASGGAGATTVAIETAVI